MAVQLEELESALLSAEPIIRQRYSRALASVQHRSDVDDLFQNVAIRAINSRHQCHGHDADEIRNWVLKIAANSCKSAISAHRKAKKRATQNESHAVYTSVENAESDEHLDLKMAIREKCSHMLSCLDRLPKSRQLIIKMRYLEERSYQEIAQFFGVTIQAARTSVCQSLSLLRAEMDQYSLPGLSDL